MAKSKKPKFKIKNKKEYGISARDQLFCKKYMKPYSVDSMKQFLFLVNQFADLNAKLRAIRLYYKITGQFRKR